MPGFTSIASAWNTWLVAMKIESPDKNLKDRISRIREILVPLWPDAKPLLNYSSCFELLCSVVLSAQCTDEQVNAVTPALFRRYPSAAELASAKLEDVEYIIHSVGFFHTKARHLIMTSRILSETYEGKVPRTMEELLTLPGVGRKTANLVSSACFGSPGLIIDTHVMRVAFRLGMYEKKDPAAIEDVLRANVEEQFHTALSHALNRHGKYLCTARAPACAREKGECPIESLCPKRGV